MSGWHSTEKMELPDKLGVDLELIEHDGTYSVGSYDYRPELEGGGKTLGPMFSVPNVQYWRYLE